VRITNSFQISRDSFRSQACSRHRILTKSSVLAGFPTVDTSIGCYSCLHRLRLFYSSGAQFCMWSAALRGRTCLGVRANLMRPQQLAKQTRNMTGSAHNKDHKSAVCIIPPRNVWDAVQNIRLFNDKGFVRYVLKLTSKARVLYECASPAVHTDPCHCHAGGLPTSTCSILSMRTLVLRLRTVQKVLPRQLAPSSHSRSGPPSQCTSMSHLVGNFLHSRSMAW